MNSAFFVFVRRLPKGKEKKAAFEMGCTFLTALWMDGRMDVYTKEK
jgi:hypothetical protein